MNKELNVFQYANVCEKTFEANLANVGSYRRKTMFYSDLSIAEWYGVESVKETFNRILHEWISNIEYITEFVMCLNWKCWEHHNKGKTELSLLYHDLYYDAQDKVLDYYKNDNKSLQYYYEILD